MTRAIAHRIFTALRKQPLITAISVLLLFAPPIFHMLLFFWPLIVSTVLGVLAVISFQQQSDEASSTPTVGHGPGDRSTAASPSHEEKISNVLMVGNQEVTWLEWLQHECEPAMWDAYGCDGSSTPSDASVVAPASRAAVDASPDGSTCEDEGIYDATFDAKDKDRLYVCSSKREGETVSAAFSTERTETRVVVLPSTVLEGLEGAAVLLEDVNKEDAKIKAPILTVKDETSCESTEKNRRCRFGTTELNGMDLTGSGEGNTHSPVLAEGNEKPMGVEGLCPKGECGNECKTVQGSTIHTKNEARGNTSAGFVSVLEGTNNCNAIADSLESTSDIKTMQNTCISQGETSLHLTGSTLQESGVHAVEFPSANETILCTPQPKATHICDQDELDMPCSSKTVSASSFLKVAEGHRMRHVNEKDEEERDSTQMATQGSQWDVSDGEECSVLRFSFFHNRSLTSS